MDSLALANKIDHTLLKADTTSDSIRVLCHEARDHHFFSVCINSFWVPYAKDILHGSSVKICSVVGFPLGANLLPVKLKEIEELLRYKVDEIDLVMNIGAFKSGDGESTFDEMQAAVALAKPLPVKIIVETSLLSHDEKIRACELVMASGAAFIKTSTGFSTGGATIEDIRLFKELSAGVLKIKASGGIRDRATAEAMIEAGAERLGTSQSVAIIKGLKQEQKENY